jgi:hypothetical protein
MPILVLYTRVRLLGGLSEATGPVTTEDFHEFLFRNTGSSLDLYFSIKKNDTGWYFSDGMEVPPSYIEQVGQRIDQELVIK